MAVGVIQGTFCHREPLLVLMIPKAQDITSLSKVPAETGAVSVPYKPNAFHMKITENQCTFCPELCGVGQALRKTVSWETFAG